MVNLTIVLGLHKTVPWACFTCKYAPFFSVSFFSTFYLTPISNYNYLMCIQLSPKIPFFSPLGNMPRYMRSGIPMLQMAANTRVKLYSILSLGPPLSWIWKWKKLYPHGSKASRGVYWKEVLTRLVLHRFQDCCKNLSLNPGFCVYGCKKGCYSFYVTQRKLKPTKINRKKDCQKVV